MPLTVRAWASRRVKAAGLTVAPIRRLHAARDALLAERAALTLALAEAHTQSNLLFAEHAALQAGHARLAESLDEARTELAAARAELCRRDTEMRTLRAIADARESELARLRQNALAVQIAALQSDLADRDRRLAAVEDQASVFGRALSHEQHRIDYALAASEGILAEVSAFHAARRTPAYREAFTERMPLVSVCVCTASRPDLLIDRCLSSLRDQTYRNLQIVVVGDHCIDETPSRVATLRDERIVFVNLPERGPYPPPGVDRWRTAGTSADNKALSLCEGSFITHLDDDDRAEPDRIAVLIELAQREEADLCWHPFWWEGPDGEWAKLGNGSFELGQVGCSAVLYHRYFARIAFDVFAYRIGEPGDWNRLRKIKMLRPKMRFVERPLVYHHSGSDKEVFVGQPGERFLD